ncbi:MAG: putative transcriptional regulator of viral defense system [Pseudohongiellaceae bacterium]|jgi:predicted transcriptional regulator of viral defense system
MMQYENNSQTKLNSTIPSNHGREILVAAAQKKAVITVSEAVSLGLSRSMLPRLEKEGLFCRVTRGVYMLSDRQPSEYETLLEAFAKPHKGVVALLSALNYHGVTTQSPSKLWLAISKGYRGLNISSISTKIVRVSVASYAYGIETHTIEGVDVKVYSLPKTIADLFKFRNKVGLDVAIEALKESINTNRVNAQEIYKAAEVCRVTRVIRPYMEAIYAN